LDLLKYYSLKTLEQLRGNPPGAMTPAPGNSDPSRYALSVFMNEILRRFDPFDTYTTQFNALSSMTDSV